MCVCEGGGAKVCCPTPKLLGPTPMSFAFHCALQNYLSLNQKTTGILVSVS